MRSTRQPGSLTRAALAGKTRVGCRERPIKCTRTVYYMFCLFALAPSRVSVSALKVVRQRLCFWKPPGRDMLRDKFRRLPHRRVEQRKPGAEERTDGASHVHRKRTNSCSQPFVIVKVVRFRWRELRAQKCARGPPEIVDAADR